MISCSLSGKIFCHLLADASFEGWPLSQADSVNFVMPCLLARSAWVGGAESCLVAKYSSRAFCMCDSFSSSALHAFTAAGTAHGIDAELWLQGSPILMCSLLPLKSSSIDLKHAILKANTCFWQSHIQWLKKLIHKKWFFSLEAGCVSGNKAKPVRISFNKDNLLGYLCTKYWTSRPWYWINIDFTMGHTQWISFCADPKITQFMSQSYD